MEYTTIAAVDLGSNSFRLQVARVVDDQVYTLDTLKEPVRLGAGLTADRYLTEEAQTRALACLKRFGERLRGLPREAVRAVGTNTLRVAKNASAFLERAEAALGVPIEIIAGREEARLIYVGVSNSLPDTTGRKLVVDIGGGSTEFIVGEGEKPSKMESLHMGCVSFSLRFFPEGKLTKTALKQAEMAARQELQYIISGFNAAHWQTAIGSSGTARSLQDIHVANRWTEAGISREGLEQLRTLLLRSGDLASLELAGLRPDRRLVLPGGFAIMSAIFAELDIERMQIADMALREGVLYDLIGRIHHQDLRESTVRQFKRRYHVDAAQAKRVEALAVRLYSQLAQDIPIDLENTVSVLMWAARLHEMGISVAHSSYHKHSAYILQHADMPGFSKAEQMALSLIVLAHRGGMGKMQGKLSGRHEWARILSLRLAVLFYRSRRDLALPTVSLQWRNNRFELTVQGVWLAANPLTAAALQDECDEWQRLGIRLTLLTA